MILVAASASPSAAPAPGRRRPRRLLSEQEAGGGHVLVERGRDLLAVANNLLEVLDVDGGLGSSFFGLGQGDALLGDADGGVDAFELGVDLGSVLMICSSRRLAFSSPSAEAA
jgi:hypothetical protein